MNKHLAVVVNKNAVWHDKEAHSLEEWRKILTNQGIKIETLSNFHLTESNYE